jgi:hypothetical protein
MRDGLECRLPAMTDHEPELPDFARIPDPWRHSAPRTALPAPRPSPPGRTRSESARGRRAALFVSAGWLGAQLAVAGVRGDIRQVPLSYALALGVAPGVGGLLCVVAAASAGRMGLGLRVGALAGLAVVVPLVFMVSGYTLSPPYAAAPGGAFNHGVFCFNVALAWTTVPLVAAGLALRGSFVTRASWRSALVGAGAGLVVAATSFLRCPLSSAWHVALSHGGAVVACALLGAGVLARVTR